MWHECSVFQGRRFIVIQKLSYRRLFCIRLLSLVSGAALIDGALAQDSSTFVSGSNQRTSIVVVSDRPTDSGTNGLSTPTTRSAAPAAGRSNRQATLDEAAANTSAPAGRPGGPGERASLEMIAPQAQAHIDYALNLAERGAVQSAQDEFTTALDLIADALDADTRNIARAHARAVQAGLTAIEETKDFVPADTPHNVVINLAQLAATHQTPVLRNVDVAQMTRAEALQRYHSYATQQLAFAGGHSAIASSALYGLGRAECVTTAGASGRNHLGAPNAMALYQAALLVDPQNYMASNELGVLMARFGDLDSAAGQLEHSLSIKPQAESWHNLAAVYRQMGQSEKAEQAERAREQLIAAPRSTGSAPKDSTDLAARPQLQWVDTETFAATATPFGLDGPAVSSNKAASVAQRESLGKRLISKLNPWPKADSPQQNTTTTELSQKGDPSRSGEAGGRTIFK
jgi:tetratricopeptide (TPR) repeat protein